MRFFLVVFVLIFFTYQLNGEERLSIIPVPSFYEINKGNFRFNGNVRLFADPEFKSELHFFQKELLRYKEFAVSTASCKEKADVIFKFRNLGCEILYQLEVTENRIFVYSGSDKGIFYGAISLLQLINNADLVDNSFLIPSLKIKDSPAYEWRGLMLDESRHFFGVEKVKSILDWMAYYKLNRFHWHLTDSPGWRIEIQKYPKLGLVGGIGNHTNPYAPAKYYTQEEIQEIVTYALERKIVIIPEIDMPGHATAANRAYPEYSGGGSERFPDWTFHPGKEDTYQYLTNILKEVDVLFPSQMIHLGGDEVSFGNHQWKTDPDVQELMRRHNLEDLKAVEDYFMRRMSDSLMKLNNHVLVWDEMADAGLPEDRSIIFWWRHDQPEQLQMGLKNGHRTVICPRLPFYFDFVQNESHRFGRKWGDRFNELHDVYNFSLSNLSIADEYEPLILGFQVNVWTETINSDKRLDYMMFPRIAAFAETVWLKEKYKDYDSFLLRLKQHLNLYRHYQLYFYNPFDENEYPEPVLLF